MRTASAALAVLLPLADPLAFAASVSLKESAEKAAPAVRARAESDEKAGSDSSAHRYQADLDAFKKAVQKNGLDLLLQGDREGAIRQYHQLKTLDERMAAELRPAIFPPQKEPPMYQNDRSSGVLTAVFVAAGAVLLGLGWLLFQKYRDDRPRDRKYFRGFGLGPRGALAYGGIVLMALGAASCAVGLLFTAILR